MKTLADMVYGSENLIASVANISNPKGRSDQVNVATAHEYLLIHQLNDTVLSGWKPEENILRRYNKTDEDGKVYREIDLRKTGDNDKREDRPNLFYFFLFNEETGDIQVSRSEDIPNGYVQIQPLRKDGSQGNWRWEAETAKKNISKLLPKLMVTRKVWTVFEKDYLTPEERVKPTSAWTKKEFNSERGSEQFFHLGFGKPDSLRPKPVGLIEHIVQLIKPDEAVALDYFAGSGTTGHAVINLNREDGGTRKYILVEMGDYFDTVLKPRIQKVVYSKDWKDGKPVSREGSSQLIKVLRLESYEDALNNLEVRRPTTGQGELDFSGDAMKGFREDYLLHYMLDVETRGSASLLNIDGFRDPFAYELKIASSSAGETQPTKVDLIETFNYLLGLQVKTTETLQGFKVVTGQTLSGEKVLVIWRNLDKKDNAALDNFLSRQKYNPRDMEFDLIYVNGDNNLQNLRREDETWKVRLIEEEFQRLMFDVRSDGASAPNLRDV